MALTSCWECKEQISDTAATCPRCGAERKAAPVQLIKEPPKKKNNPLLWIVAVPVGFFVLFLLYGASIPEYEAAARERRGICEKIAAPYQRGECDRIYAADIARGKQLAAEKSRR